MKKLNRGTYLGRNTFESDMDGIIITINEYAPGLRSDWHFHENSYFTLIQKGGSVERRSTGSFECKPGMLLFYNFEEAHRNENYQPRSKNFSVELEDKWYKKYNIDKRTLSGTFNIADLEIKKLFTDVFRESVINDQFSKLGIEGLMLQVVTGFLRSEHNAGNTVPGWVMKLKELLYYEDHNNFNLSYLSRQLQMHPVTLSKQFPLYFKTGFAQYIRNIKCQRALILLGHKTLTVDEIAWQCGFTDGSHMAKAFRLVYGMSPSEYRNALG